MLTKGLKKFFIQYKNSIKIYKMLKQVIPFYFFISCLIILFQVL